jgi:hypothetical protein
MINKLVNFPKNKIVRKKTVSHSWDDDDISIIVQSLNILGAIVLKEPVTSETLDQIPIGDIRFHLVEFLSRYEISEELVQRIHEILEKEVIYL